MSPHQVFSSGPSDHSAPTWRPHAAAWGAMDYDDKIDFIEQHVFDGDLAGAGEYPMVDAMVGKDYALPAIINAIEKFRDHGGML